MDLFFLIFKGLGFTSYIEEVRSVLQECKTQAAVSELNLCICFSRQVFIGTPGWTEVLSPEPIYTPGG